MVKIKDKQKNNIDFLIDDDCLDDIKKVLGLFLLRIDFLSEGAGLIAGNSRNGWGCRVIGSGEKISIYRKK